LFNSIILFSDCFLGVFDGRRVRFVNQAHIAFGQHQFHNLDMVPGRSGLGPNGSSDLRRLVRGLGEDKLVVRFVGGIDLEEPHHSPFSLAAHRSSSAQCARIRSFSPGSSGLS
jgi:hypothetical protein